ncbi:MAG: hypothetical protein GWM98_07030 [Nitrospinaceae bacterium]|nr:hypothetical protein [Nitrospinaceae bacterium]NIR56653.1 hypothetical protein [Nitrospinaceae bacterium]NIS87116.1 hypothetical protein [Nitrospinaceae bacterium]NIT81509.1 hypothetical protein [Nitrospinaceae bacterium]NIU43794.1 hypothetical protein [Nitrospinaceae bacterium]
MIDEIDYFQKRDKYKKKKGLDEEWGALKKIKSSQDSGTPKKKTGDPDKKRRRKPDK